MEETALIDKRQKSHTLPRPLFTIEVNFEVGRIEINDRRVLWMEREEDKESGRGRKMGERKREREREERGRERKRDKHSLHLSSSTPSMTGAGTSHWTLGTHP